MKISVITPTCRQNPRLDIVGRTLAASLARSTDVELEWIIVDELKRDVLALTAVDSWHALRGDKQMSIVSVSPLPSAYRNGGPDQTPAHNSARNAGLAIASGEYVVMLNDCNIVTPDWVQVAHDVATQGLGWTCKMHSVQDMAVPANGIFRMKDHHDRLHPVPVMSAARAAWGAPMAAFRKIDGFDLSYDGQRKGNDVETILRLSRVGITFVATERAFTVQFRRTKNNQEISTVREAYSGARNLALLNALIKDKARTLPLQSSGVFVRKAAGKFDPKLVAPKVAVIPPAAPPVGDARPADDAAPVTPTPTNGASDREQVVITPDEVGELDVDDFGGLA